jgi:hypothetical protein
MQVVRAEYLRPEHAADPFGVEVAHQPVVDHRAAWTIPLRAAASVAVSASSALERRCGW